MQASFFAFIAATIVITTFWAQALASETAPSATSAASPAAAASATPMDSVLSPPSTWTFPVGQNDLEIPAQFYNGVIVIRMMVAGRGIDMSLDTGAGFNFIDPSIIALLPDHASAAPPYVEDAQFGKATLHNVGFASRPFMRRYGTNTRIAGILGFSFLLNAVVKVDYEHESIHVINPSSFVVPDGATVLVLDPTARVPLVQATIGKASGTSFIIDTGAATVVVFPRLAKANPQEFSRTQQLNDDALTTYYRSFWPLCGAIQQNPYAVSQIAVGKVGIHDWTVWKPEDKSCFAPPGIDGLIGYDFLRLFNVYIDYPDSRVILEPNKLYEAATNTFKP